MSRFDFEFVRRQFPALETPWALFDNAGGSVCPRHVIDQVHDYMSRYQVQLGASYALSRESQERIDAGRHVAASMMGATPDEVVIGSSTSANVILLAQALAPTMSAGDRVIVTNLDHEANIGAWRRLAERGMELVEWPFSHETGRLELSALEPLLDDRTRLICMSHCSNVTGTFNDVSGAAKLAHDAGAKICVDGVAWAPHRRVDVRAWGVDFYLVSLYKTFGPHLAMMFGKRELLREARSPYHFFIGEHAVPDKMQPGGVNHELTASLVGIRQYFEDLDARHGGAEDSPGGVWERTFSRIADYEELLCERFMAYLRSRSDVRIIGSTSSDQAERAPIVSFVVEGWDSARIPEALDRKQVAVRFGHFYAYRAIESLGLHEVNGVVRVSMAHYNTVEEVDRLIAGLDELLDR